MHQSADGRRMIPALDRDEEVEGTGKRWEEKEGLFQLFTGGEKDDYLFRKGLHGAE